MTPRIFFSLLATTAMLAVLAAVSVQHVAFVTTTTGRSVRLAHLSHLATPNVAAHLYEVTADLQLTGLDRSHDLNSITVPSPLRPSEHMPTIRIDGVDRPDLLEMQRERRGGGYVVSHVADGPVVAVWGNGLALQPLNLATHPGLFVNLRSAQSVGNDGDANDLHDDMMYPPNELGQVTPEAIPQTDVIPSSSSNETAALPTTLPQRASCKQASSKKLEIAVAFDRALCQRYGGDKRATTTALRSMFAKAGQPFLKHTCIIFQIVFLEGSCKPPSDDYKRLSQVSPTDILKEFGSIWRESRVDVPRDIAVFIPGLDMYTATSGVAWVGGACSTQFGYGWSIAEPIVIAHEIGHLMNADHSKKGLMNPRWRPGDALRFSPESINAIVKFVERDRDSSCLNEDTGGSGDGGGTDGTVMPPTTSPPTTGTTPTDGEETNQPPTVSGTCASSFNYENSLRCVKKEFSLNVYGNSGAVVATTKLKIFQLRGKFQFILIGGKSVQIKSVSILATFDQTVTEADLPPRTKYGGKGRHRHKYEMDIGQLSTQPGNTSCCGRTYYIYVLVNHCYQSNTCSEKFFKDSRTVKCRPCNRIGFMPMSADRKCPSCS